MANFPTTPLQTIPAPPTDMVMPEPLQAIIIWISVASIATYSVWALSRLVRHKDSLPASLLLGGFLVFFSIEPFYDVLGFVYHPEIGQLVAFKAFGRNFPLHLLLLYGVYYAALAVYFDKKFASGVSAKWVWWAFWLWTPAQIVFETPLLLQGLWSYYGDPPFRVGFYPLWIAPATAGSCIFAFSLIHYLKNIITPAWMPMMSLVMASGVAAGCLGTCWPMFLALNVDRDTWPSGAVLTVPASLLTIGLSAGFTWLSLHILELAKALTVEQPRRAAMRAADGGAG